MAKTKSFHIGSKIAELLKLRHMTKSTFAQRMGYNPSMANYMIERETMEVSQLQRAGMVLQYDFFAHYPIKLATAPPDERDSRIAELTAQLEAVKKVLGEQLLQCQRELDMQKKENHYLQKINDLLEGRGKK